MRDLIQALIGIPVVLVGILVIAAVQVGVIVGVFWLANVLSKKDKGFVQ